MSLHAAAAESICQQRLARGKRRRDFDLPMTVREVLKMLHQDGWQVHRQRGSDRQLKHPEKPGTVTVAGNAGSEIKRGTLRTIFAQAGIEWPPRID